MIARFKPTRRLTLASLFAVVALLGALGATGFGSKSLVILESEDWYFALIYLGAAALSLGVGGFAWVKLRSYRPEEAIPAAWRNRFRDHRTDREKFRANLIAYSVLLAVLGISVAVFFVAFPKAAAQTQGERVQFLAVSALVLSAYGYFVFEAFRSLVRSVPGAAGDNQPLPAPRGGSVRRLAAGLVGWTLIGFGFCGMGIVGKQMYAVWGEPALGTFDYLFAVGVVMVVAAYCLYMGGATIRPRRRTAPVGSDLHPAASKSDAIGAGPGN